MTLMDDLNKLLSPLGTRDNPAISCQDIAHCRGDVFSPGMPETLSPPVSYSVFLFSHFSLHSLFLSSSIMSVCFHYCMCYNTTGYYWIDPNEGSPKDAIKVYCKGAETCLTPNRKTSSEVRTPYN